MRAFGIIFSAEAEDELKVSTPRSRRTGDLGTAVTQLRCLQEQSKENISESGFIH